MITIQNEDDFLMEFMFSSEFSTGGLKDIIEWINKNLNPEDVFDNEKLLKYEKQKLGISRE